jgi:hypothetical protein
MFEADTIKRARHDRTPILPVLLKPGCRLVGQATIGSNKPCRFSGRPVFVPTAVNAARISSLGPR